MGVPTSFFFSNLEGQRCTHLIAALANLHHEEHLGAQLCAAHAHATRRFNTPGRFSGRTAKVRMERRRRRRRRTTKHSKNFTVSHNPPGQGPICRSSLLQVQYSYLLYFTFVDYEVQYEYSTVELHSIS